VRPLPHTRSCFVCGEANAAGLKLRLETDGSIIRTRFTPGPEHIGFKQVTHGGILATVLDEIMAWTCAVHAHRFAFCAEMTVRFVNPGRPGEELTGTGELISNRRNRVFDARAELRSADGRLIASATGRYLPIKSEDLAAMERDLIGELPWKRSEGP